MSARITDVRSRLYRVPLPRPWGSEVTAHHLLVCDVETSEGATGRGFTWTPNIGGRAAHALVTHECREALLGAEPHPTVTWDRLWRHLHEAGSGGVTSLALAAVDTALWDLRTSQLGLSLAAALGQRRDSVAAYGSGINYDYELDELTEQAHRWVAAGYPAVKIKVGHPDLDEDVERVARVRQVIGPHRALMVDANQRWNLPEARRAIRALSRFDLWWVEEPLLADDVHAYRDLRSRIDVPVALGENQRTVFQFRDLLISGACDIVQPNVARIGGITPFLAVAALADAFSTPVFPHYLPELSGQLAMCLTGEVMVEHIEDASFADLEAVHRPPVVIADGRAHLRPRLGLGLEFATHSLELLAGSS